MDFQPHLPLRQQTAEKPAQQREHQHDESGESIGNRRKADPGKAEDKLGLQVKKRGKDEQAGIPFQQLHPPPLPLGALQYGDTVGKADARFERDDYGHVLQRRRILEIVGELRLGLQDSIRICRRDESAADGSEEQRLPSFPEADLQDAIDENE